MTAPDVDRVWWPETPHPDESLLGFCVRTMDENVLPHLPAFLAQAGQKHRHRHVDIVRGEADPGVIAAVLGVDEAEIALRRGETTSNGIVYRGLDMDAADLCTRVRRFAPTSLEREAIHRADWCIRTLPICPETLEILQSTCVCGRRQSWTTTIGPDRCQECGIPLERVPAVHSRSEDAEALRSYAGLFSLQPEVNADAVAGLPYVVRMLPRGELVELILAFVPIVEGQLRVVRRPDCWLNNGPLFASAIARVWRLLEEWPLSLVDRAFGLVEPEAAAPRLPPFVRLGRLLSSSKPARTALASNLIREVATCLAVPGEGDRHAIDYHEAASLMGVPASALRQARRQRELETRFIFRRGELLPVLKRSEAQDLSTLDVVGAAVLGRLTWIPRYGIAQLAAGGVVKAVDHPFVRERYGIRIERRSVEELVERLELASTEVGSDSLPLAVAMSAVGGREKPYLEVFRALLDGRLPFALAAGNGRLTRRVRIARASLPVLQTLGHEHPGFYDHYVLDDARNVLNLHGRDAGALDPYRSGTKRSAAIFDRTLIVSLASRNIGLAEAAVRTGLHPATITGVLNRAGVSSGSFGWDREAAETELGIVA